MELFFELLLTAAATLFVAFLLAKLISANNDPRHGPAVGPADVIAEEKVEEERIVEVDDVKAKGARADAAAPTLSEGWVEVEKAPAEGKPAWVAVEEGVPATLAPELFLGTVLEERKEEGEVGKKQRDLTPEVEVAAQVKPRDFGAETRPVSGHHREVIDVELEKETVQQHDSGAEVGPGEVLDAELQKQQVQATEAVVVEQRHPVAEAAPAEVIDAGLEEEEAQADEAIPLESASETVPDEVLDVVLEKQVEEQVTEANQHELAAEVAPREIPDVLAGEEELKEQSVEEVLHQHEEVQNKEEAQWEAAPVDQQEKLVPKEELAVRKADDLQVSQEGSSNDKVVVQLPEKEAALQEMPEDEDRANMEFEEWEGIERSEVEKRFGAAAAFAASNAGAATLSKLDSDVQLQLQGLLKVAIDGPCYDSTQPLTLRPSSRAKWVSWQKLGNMHPEIAMEKYMDLLSQFIPRWMGDKTSNTKKHDGDVDSEGDSLTMTTHTSDQQTNQGNDRNEASTSIDEGPLTSPPNPDKEQRSDIPAE